MYHKWNSTGNCSTFQLFIVYTHTEQWCQYFAFMSIVLTDATQHLGCVLGECDFIEYCSNGSQYNTCIFSVFRLSAIHTAQPAYFFYCSHAWFQRPNCNGMTILMSYGLFPCFLFAALCVHLKHNEVCVRYLKVPRFRWNVAPLSCYDAEFEITRSRWNFHQKEQETRQLRQKWFKFQKKRYFQEKNLFWQYSA